VSSAREATGGCAPRPADAFRFGRNWKRYVERYLDPERVAIAAASLRDLVGEPLTGKSFLDIGSGSGLFSLVAFREGAAHVTSLDVDPESIAATAQLRRSAGDPGNWDVVEGSILDPAVVEQLGQADVVYAWGVLHHTGDMHTALRRAASLVEPGGLFVLAIYNRAEDGVFDSAGWLRIKRAYNHVGRWRQRLMEMGCAAYYNARLLAGGTNPVRYAREYKQRRGMALGTDLVDWLGGYPYEYATAEEVVQVCEAHCGMRVVRVIPERGGGLGNNQFVFRRVDR